MPMLLLDDNGGAHEIRTHPVTILSRLSPAAGLPPHIVVFEVNHITLNHFVL